MGKRRLKTMNDILLDGKRVLLRVDFNVASGEGGEVAKSDDYRLKAAIPTIEELMQRRCRILLLTHRGRPQEGDDNVSVEPVRKLMERLLGSEVKALRHLMGGEVEAVASGMEQGSVAMLPNVRLDEREEANSDKFAAELAEVADVYVNEAFSVSHRDHASVAKVPRLLPSCAGRRTVHEYGVLTDLLDKPQRPYVAVVSGAKVQTKVKLLDNLLASVDQLCLGGIIANIFLAALGKCPAEQCGDGSIAAAERLFTKAADKIVLPADVVIGSSEGDKESVKVVPVDGIPDDAAGVWDVGPATVKRYLDVLLRARTIMWNGPLGKFEVEEYAGGTTGLAQGLAGMESWRVVGGGDTISALTRLNLVKKFDHVSVGGGAMIALLEGGPMPGLEPLFI